MRTLQVIGTQRIDQTCMTVIVAISRACDRGHRVDLRIQLQRQPAHVANAAVVGQVHGVRAVGEQARDRRLQCFGLELHRR